MKDPRRLTAASVGAMQAELLADFGGAEGLRDAGGLEGAVERPRQAHAYDVRDLCELAAKYGHGLCSSHPFVDGNKRVALATLATFLEINGLELTATEPDSVLVILALARGDLDEARLAEWVRANVRKLESGGE